jgi:hypothetical protein
MYQTSCHNIPQDSDLHKRRLENLTSHQQSNLWIIVSPLQFTHNIPLLTGKTIWKQCLDKRWGNLDTWIMKLHVIRPYLTCPYKAPGPDKARCGCAMTFTWLMGWKSADLEQANKDNGHINEMELKIKLPKYYRLLRRIAVTLSARTDFGRGTYGPHQNHMAIHRIYHLPSFTVLDRRLWWGILMPIGMPC